MGSPYFSLGVQKLMPLSLCNLILGLVKDIFMVVPYCISIVHKFLFDKHNVNFAAEYHPPPSLVPVPFHCVVGAIKERFRVVEYSCVKGRIRANKVSNSVCVVCLERMETSDEVRELCNCCHVFHRVCLDAWIDQGQVTCPLCRAKLLPHQGEELNCGDPWRRERMIYLFGDDFAFGTS